MSSARTLSCLRRLPSPRALDIPERPPRKTLALPTACLLLALPGAASAHVVSGEAVGFLSGLKHPVSGGDHIIAMIAVGLWGAQLGSPAIWLLPITFPLVMAYAGFLGLIGVTLPGTEIGIALSGVCLGACVLAELRPPLWVAGLLVGSFGLFHGYAHGVELQPGADALFYSIGFVVATGLLHATGITIGVVHRWEWGRQGLRGAGMLILCGGLYFMWTAVK
jgi:urease accessory protein